MTWHNPIKKGGFADPFVLRYNGSYYLYCTGRRIDCWRSKNLIDWELYGPVIGEDEFPGLCPFAPEVVYHNGSFYMYTSPSGQGHYVLKSDSPLGPFRKITDNIGHAIDFSVFVDDDGAWYAYWADDQGILGCRMPSPTEFGTPQYVGASLHGWTEGPFVVKVDGKYHLTYTGNHFLSKGYRIQGACADSPLGPYKDYPHNPIAVRTQGDVVGLGHSSTVLGPDLQTFYIFYHNLNPDRTRDLNLDRMFFRGAEAYVMGPTTTPQAAPELPDFADFGDSISDENWRIEKGGWQVKNDMRITDGAFAARCTDKLPQEGAAELHFAAASTETEQYGVGFHTGERELLLFVEKASRCIVLSEPFGSPIWKVALPHDYCHSALHRLTVRFDCGSTDTAVFFDTLRLPQIPGSLGGSEFGYFASGKMLVGSTAFSKKRDRVYWPVPTTAAFQGDLYVSVPESGRYIAAFTGGVPPEPDLVIDGSPADVCVLHKTPGVVSVAADFTAGVHHLGSASKAAGQVTLFRAPDLQTEKLKAQLAKWDKQIGMAEYVDFELTAQMTVAEPEADWEAGVIFRASNLADGGEGDDKVLGTNFFIGYRLSVSDGYIRLWRHRYDQRLLKEVPVVVPHDIHLSIQAVGSIITCSLGDTAVLHFTDDSPIIAGGVGFHARGCSINRSELVCTGKALDRQEAVLPGNSAAFDLNTVEELPRSPLKGMNIAFLGSSVTRGHAAEGISFVEFMSRHNGCTYTKEAVSGTTLADTGPDSYVQRMLHSMKAEDKYDLFICQLSTNDATQGRPLGKIEDSFDLNDFDTSTVIGAVEYIICYAQKTWKCPVVFYSSPRFACGEYQEMVDALYRLQEKWGIGLVDLWNTLDVDIADYNLYMSDAIHPTKAGYLKWWLPVMEQSLYQVVTGKQIE